MTKAFWNSSTGMSQLSDSSAVSSFRVSLHALTRYPAQALHLISTGSAEPPEQLWKVTKPHNTKFLGCGCWLGPSKPASPYRACFIAILQNSRGVREMQTVMLESSSPQSICRKAFPACCLYSASRICGEGRAILVPKGVRRERQSLTIAPDLQILGKAN